jgi:hypothetical protein
MIAIMQRTQIQLPEPLFRQVKQIAEARDWSVAELVRRSIEAYVQTFPVIAPKANWTMPVLRGSGGHLQDPAPVNAEADAVEARFAKSSASR